MQVTHAVEATANPSAHAPLSIETVARDVAIQSLPFRSQREKLLDDHVNDRHVDPGNRHP